MKTLPIDPINEAARDVMRIARQIAKEGKSKKPLVPNASVMDTTTNLKGRVFGLADTGIVLVALEDGQLVERTREQLEVTR